MDENNAIQAMVIGVSVFIGIITITAVLLYYNTAKDAATRMGVGVDSSELYEKGIQDILLKGAYTSNVEGASTSSYVTGTDVKNLLNYFYQNEGVEINIRGAKNIEDQNIISNTDQVNNNESNYNLFMKNIIPNQKFKLENKTENNIMKLTLTGQ